MLLATWQERLQTIEKQMRYYSGKKKRHTLKTQMLVNPENGEIIALTSSNGKKHDFQLFEDSRIHVKAKTVLEAATGYQWLVRIHPNSPFGQKGGQEPSFDQARVQ